jgi:hypothetical protein
MRERVPAIIAEVSRLNPWYPAPVHRALEQLRIDIIHDARIRMCPDTGMPDIYTWAKAWLPRRNETWLNSQWFFAEVFVYRHIIETVGWYHNRQDPFEPQKAAELASPTLRERIEISVSGRDLPATERLREAFHNALWGNRIDLSYALAMAHGSAVHDDDLLVDHSDAVIRHLARTPGEIHIVHDNYGTEFACDLALIDTLLETTGCQIVEHFKAHPTFVSDVTLTDDQQIRALLRTGRYGPEGQAMVQRLDRNEARIQRRANWYWNSPLFGWEMPDSLQAAFRGAALVIFKGDLNYRRIVGDALWPPTTPWQDVMAYFPAPVLALRTLKSNPICGLPAGMSEQLDGIDNQWRVNGKRGVIQFRP